MLVASCWLPVASEVSDLEPTSSARRRVNALQLLSCLTPHVVILSVSEDSYVSGQVFFS